MTPREFFDLVCEYREAEQEYEKLHSPGAMMKMADRRQKIDKLIDKAKENEKVRQELISLVSHSTTNGTVQQKKLIAWIEKQK